MDKYSTSDEDILNLGDVMDLSVIELYLLNYLIRVAGSIVRFTVFNEINQQLGDDKSISRSSFYNSLENLEEKGFVKIEKTESGRKSAVKALPKAKLAIQQVNIFNIWGSVDPDTKFKELIEKYFNHFSPLDLDNGMQLICSLQYPANQEIIELLSSQFKEVKLLGNDSQIGPIADEYNLVNTDDKGIIERNEMFDQVVIYRYAYNEMRFGFEFDNLVDEAIRITKSGGTIIFFALEDLKTTNNLILEAGIGTVLEDVLERQSTKNLKSILQVAERSNLTWEEINYNGLSMILVRKLANQ